MIVPGMVPHPERRHQVFEHRPVHESRIALAAEQRVRRGPGGTRPPAGYRLSRSRQNSRCALPTPADRNSTAPAALPSRRSPPRATFFRGWYRKRKSISRTSRSQVSAIVREFRRQLRRQAALPGSLGERQRRLLQRPQARGQVAAVHRRDETRLQRGQRLDVVPVEHVPAIFRRCVTSRSSVCLVSNTNSASGRTPEMHRRDARIQQQSQIRRRKPQRHRAIFAHAIRESASSWSASSSRGRSARSVPPTRASSCTSFALSLRLRRPRRPVQPGGERRAR